jgi:hypothetical protein
MTKDNKNSYRDCNENINTSAPSEKKSESVRAKDKQQSCRRTLLGVGGGVALVAVLLAAPIWAIVVVLREMAKQPQDAGRIGGDIGGGIVKVIVVLVIVSLVGGLFSKFKNKT